MREGMRRQNSNRLTARDVIRKPTDTHESPLLEFFRKSVALLDTDSNCFNSADLFFDSAVKPLNSTRFQKDLLSGEEDNDVLTLVSCHRELRILSANLISNHGLTNSEPKALSIVR